MKNLYYIISKISIQRKYRGMISFFGMLFLLISSLNAQEKEINSSMQPLKHNLGDTIVIALGTEVRINDHLSIKLKHFSHKTTITNELTKATALLSVSNDFVNDQLLISTYKKEGVSEVEYETRFWNGFRFQLIEFDYDSSITVLVEKGEEEEPYRKLFKL